MGFLKKFFRNVFHEGAPEVVGSSFDRLSEDELEAHLGVAKYGNFTLTGAVSSSMQKQGRKAFRFKPRPTKRPW